MKKLLFAALLATASFYASADNYIVRMVTDTETVSGIISTSDFVAGGTELVMSDRRYRIDLIPAPYDQDNTIITMSMQVVTDAPPCDIDTKNGLSTNINDALATQNKCTSKARLLLKDNKEATFPFGGKNAGSRSFFGITKTISQGR